MIDGPVREKLMSFYGLNILFFSWKKHKHVLCANHESATKLALNTMH